MRRRAMVVAALLALAVLLTAGCGDDGEGDGRAGADDEGGVITLDIVHEQLVGGVRRESVPLGDSVTLVVTGDSTDQVHVHGYDRYIELDEGQGELVFTALIPGIFEVELEAAGRLLIELEVS